MNERFQFQRNQGNEPDQGADNLRRDLYDYSGSTKNSRPQLGGNQVDVNYQLDSGMPRTSQYAVQRDQPIANQWTPQPTHQFDQPIYFTTPYQYVKSISGMRQDEHIRLCELDCIENKNIYNDRSMEPSPQSRMPFQDQWRRANENFISQEQSQWNTNAPFHNSDCGPTSIAMALKILGKVQPGFHPDQAGDLIMKVRQELTGNEDHHEGLNPRTVPRQVQMEAQRYGLNAQPVHGLEQIDSALDSGKVVLSGGNPHYNDNGQGTWQSRLSDSQYPQRANGLHHILVVGKNDRGQYIVNDPLSKVGSLLVSGQELKAFIAAPRAVLHGGMAIG